MVTPTNFATAGSRSTDILPGRYQAAFINPRTGVASWPKFVETTLEETSCSNALGKGDVQLRVPAIAQDQCRELVKNGSMESWTIRLGNITKAVLFWTRQLD